MCNLKQNKSKKLKEKFLMKNFIVSLSKVFFFLFFFICVQIFWASIISISKFFLKFEKKISTKHRLIDFLVEIVSKYLAILVLIDLRKVYLGVLIRKRTKY